MIFFVIITVNAGERNERERKAEFSRLCVSVVKRKKKQYSNYLAKVT